MARTSIQRVTKQELRDLFNTEHLPKIQRGELLVIVESDGTPGSKAAEPPGTRSRMVSYWEVVEGRLVEVALTHQYVRPDGTWGGSGKRLPDPKRVRHQGVVYAPHVKPPSKR